MTKIRLDVSTKLTIVQAVGGGWIKKGSSVKRSKTESNKGYSQFSPGGQCPTCRLRCGTSLLSGTPLLEHFVQALRDCPSTHL